MSQDDSAVARHAQVMEWAKSLAPVAMPVVADADMTQPYIFTEVTAAPDQLPVLRREFDAWAHRVGFPDERVQDVVLAVDEAASNVVEHAYPGTAGPVKVLAACGRLGRTASVVVADSGRWCPVPADPGVRGRGLAMMRTLADVFHLAPTPAGSTVLLGWSLPV